MRLLYENTDITDRVLVRECLVADSCGEECDSLALTLENAAGWARWGPKEDDRIAVTQDGYESGTMFLHSVLPEDGTFRVLATGLPCRARQRENRSFENRTIEEILRSCAMAGGMGFLMFGIENVPIPYIEQRDETAAALLERLLRLEGAALKCINGNYVAVGLQWAQSRDAVRTLRLTSGQEGTFWRRSGTRLRTLCLETPYGSAAAEDTAAPVDAGSRTVGGLGARDLLQAGRWARALLTDHNRRCESLRLETSFDPRLGALLRADLTGAAETEGAWLVEKAVHDLVAGTSAVTLRRCIDSVR